MHFATQLKHEREHQTERDDLKSPGTTLWRMRAMMDMSTFAAIRRCTTRASKSTEMVQFSIGLDLGSQKVALAVYDYVRKCATPVEIGGDKTMPAAVAVEVCARLPTNE